MTINGRFTQVRDFTLAPRPAHPVPVWVAGRSPAAMRRAARHDGWMPYMVTPERLADTVAEVRRAAESEGLGPWRGRVAVHLFTTVDADPRAARRIAVEQVGETYRQDFEGLADRYLVHGDAAGCVARIMDYVDAGADTVVLRLAPGPRGAEHLTEVLAHEVLPELRRRSASRSTDPGPFGTTGLLAGDEQL